MGGGGAKLARAIVFADSNWSEAAIGHVWSGGEGNRYLVLDPASGTDAAGNLRTTKYNDFANLRWLGARVGATPLFDAARVGDWHCVEAHMRLNDPGSANGVFELWVDGNTEASHPPNCPTHLPGWPAPLVSVGPSSSLVGTDAKRWSRGPAAAVPRAPREAWSRRHHEHPRVPH